MRTLIGLLLAALLLIPSPALYLAEKNPMAVETPVPLPGPPSELETPTGPIPVGVTSRWLESWQSTWW